MKIKSWIKRLPVDVGCAAVGRRNGRDKASLLLGECDIALLVHWYLFIRRHNNIDRKPSVKAFKDFGEQLNGLVLKLSHYLELTDYRNQVAELRRDPPANS